MKRLLCILLAVCLAVCAASCTQATPPSPGNTATTQTQPAHFALPQAVVELTECRLDGFVSVMEAAGNGHIALQCEAGLDENDLTRPGAVAAVSVVDVPEKKAIATLSISSGMQELIGARADGRIVIRNYEKDTIDVYKDDTVERSLPISEEATGAFFRYLPAGDALYAVDEERLLRLSPDDGALSTAATLPGYGVSIHEYDPVSRRIVFVEDDDNLTSGIRWSVYDNSTNSVLVGETAHEFSSLTFSAGRVLERFSSLAVTQDGEDSPQILVVYGNDGVRQHAWQLTPNAVLHSAPQSGYAMIVFFDFSNEGERTHAEARFVDLANGRWAALPTAGNCTDVRTVYLPECGYWAVALTEGIGQGSVTRLMAVDPAQLTFAGTLPDAQAILTPDTALADYFQPARKLADEIEREFSVQILLGNECMATRDDGTFHFVSTQEDDDYEMTDAERAEEQENALRTLRSELEHYPKGFFKKFKMADGRGGLRFLYLRDLPNDTYDSFTAGGVTYACGLCQHVALKISDASAPTIHHEIWHAVEGRIQQEGCHETYLSDDQWATFNPEGFSYVNDLDSYIDEQYESYFLGAGDDPYFIYNYSTVNEREDRATLVEAVMERNDPDFISFVDGDYTDGYDWVSRYPHLKAKLDQLGKATKAVFGCEYWKPAA
ncbi:MAG: hypothetical protein ACOYJY_02815 [Acutalibacteraceae bacterium]|jgi:hypothetical protein